MIFKMAFKTLITFFPHPFETYLDFSSQFLALLFFKGNLFRLCPPAVLHRDKYFSVKFKASGFSLWRYPHKT